MAIKNQYAEKTAEQVWTEWNIPQKAHFLKDHFEEITGRPLDNWNDFDEKAFENRINESYYLLPIEYRKAIQNHIEEEQYKRGGEIYGKGGSIDDWDDKTIDKIYGYYLDELSSHDRKIQEKNIKTIKQKREFLKKQDNKFRKQFSGGGNIPNNYEGKTGEKVWGEWTILQRGHFLYDHEDEINDLRSHIIRREEEIENDEAFGSPSITNIEDFSKWEYEKLPSTIKESLKGHIEVSGQYAHGGDIVNSFDYRLLSRLQSDNEYYLGHGNRSEKNLWAGNVDAQIAEMKRLWNKVYPKPEWLSMEDILEYEKKMKDQYANGGSIYKKGGIPDVIKYEYTVYDNGEWRKSTRKDFKYWYSEFGAEVMDSRGIVHKKGDIPFEKVENVYNPQGYMIAEKISKAGKGGMYADGGEIGEGKNTYKAFFSGKEIDVKADSSYQAQQKAVQHFKPAKSKTHMVHVVLLSVGDNEIIHKTSEYRKGGIIDKVINWLNEPLFK